MFGFFSNKIESREDDSQIVVVSINARLQPMHRGEIYEAPLNYILTKKLIGSVSGGGCCLSESGEIEYCIIEIELNKCSDESIKVVKSILEKLGIPKGSKIRFETECIEINFGTLEGLALYLNGTDLDDDIYSDCDVNHVYNELNRLTNGVGKVFSYWQGPTETAIYLYGMSFLDMKSQITELVETYPLCQKCRIEKIT